MASVWIRRRPRARGGWTYRVEYRPGGFHETVRYGGSFSTIREATIRKQWIAGELAAMRMPDIRALASAADPTTVAQAAKRWLESRRDVAEGTRKTYDVALGRIQPKLGRLPLADITPARVNAFIEELVAVPLKRESIRKTCSVLALILDHEGVEPNPVRSPHVKLPRGKRRHVTPPTAAHVVAVHQALPDKYRLPLVVLEATGMRIGELALLTWGDLDEPRGRWRCGHKTEGSLRWVSPPDPVLTAVLVAIFAGAAPAVPQIDPVPAPVRMGSPEPTADPVPSSPSLEGDRVGADRSGDSEDGSAAQGTPAA